MTTFPIHDGVIAELDELARRFMDAGCDTARLYELISELEDTSQAWEKLRAPFPAEMIGKLPKITCGKCREAHSKSCDQHRKSECRVCHNWITSAHLHLDYVGHAAVTDRLNQVDPFWTWRPIRWTDDGQPAFDRNGGMWIELTILGKTLPAYGDAEGKRGADAVKAAISDAIKNGAMRFGVGIDLWSKEDLLAANPPAVEEEQPRRARQPEDEPYTQVIWLQVPGMIDDVDVLTEKAKECDAAGQFKGEVKTAFLKRKRELERHLKAVKDEPAAS